MWWNRKPVSTQDTLACADALAVLAAVERSVATIEFTPDGHVVPCSSP